MKKLVNAVLKFLRLGNPVTWGVAFSLILLLALVCIFRLQDCVDGVCQNKWQKLLASSPNEIGDTLAGVAGALAFLWIIVTVWLQSQELREQRKEMQLQRQEFEKMVEAQEAQVTALKAQADIFEDEKRARDELRKEKYLNQLLDRLVKQIDECNSWCWHFFYGTGPMQPVTSVYLFFPQGKADVSDIDIRTCSIQTGSALAALKGKLATKKISLPQEKYQRSCFEILETVCTIMNEQMCLPNDQKERIKTMMLAEMKCNLEEVLKLPVWKNPSDG